MALKCSQNTTWLRLTILVTLLSPLSFPAVASQDSPNSPQTAPGEILFRDDFEPPSRSEGWHPVARWGGTVEAARWSASDGRRDSSALILNAGGAKVGWERNAIPAIPGATYELKAWLKGATINGGAYLGVAFAGRKGDVIAELQSEPVNSPADWKRASTSAVAPPEATLVAFFCAADGNGQVSFDDATAFVTVPTRIRLVSFDFPRAVPEGEQAALKVTLEALQDVSTPPSLAALVSPIGSDMIMVRTFHRLLGPDETWRKGQIRQVEIPFLSPQNDCPPGRYRLKIELRNAVWADTKEPPRAEFEIVRSQPVASAISLGLPVYEGPRVVKPGHPLAFSLKFNSPTEVPPGRGFAWLTRQDELWSVATFAFPGGKAEIRLDSIALDLPEEIPPGDYQLAVGIVEARYEGKEPGECSTWNIRVLRAAPREGYPSPRPLSHGVFVDSSLIPHFWWVNQQATLFWDAQPYLPIGVSYCPTFLRDYSPDKEPRNEANWQLLTDALRTLRSQGLLDMLIIPGRPLTEIPPSALQRTVDELECLGFRYGIELNAGPQQPLTGFWINNGITLQDVAPDLDYTTPPAAFPLAKDSTALFLALDPDTHETLQTGTTPLPAEPALVVRQAHHPEGNRGAEQRRFNFRLAGATTHATVFFAPQVQLDASSSQQNLWEGFDSSVQQLSEYLSAIRFGPGLRFFIDPLRPGLSFSFPSLLPNSQQFAQEYQQWLQQRFVTLESLDERWCLSGQQLTSFSEAASLVPMAIVGQTGFLVSTASLRPFRMDLSRSLWWLDWLDFRDQSVALKFSRLASAIKQVVQVPVIVGQSPPAAPYHVAWDQAGSGIDGVAARTYAPSLPRAGTNAVAACASASQSAKTLWCLATLDLSSSPTPSLTEEMPAEVPLSGPETVRDWVNLLSCGAKGLYLAYQPPTEPTSTPQPAQPDALTWLADLRQRTNSAANSLAGYHPPLAYWLPSTRPEESNFSLPVQEPLPLEEVWTGRQPIPVQGGWLVPAWRLPDDLSPVVLDPQNEASARKNLPLLAQALQQDHRPRVYLGHLLFSEQLETLVKYFTTQLEPDSDGALVQVLAPTPSSEVLARTPSGGAWHIRDGTLEIISKSLRLSSPPEEARPPEADLLHLFDFGPAQKYYSPVEFGEKLLGLP